MPLGGMLPIHHLSFSDHIYEQSIRTAMIPFPQAVYIVLRSSRISKAQVGGARIVKTNSQHNLQIHGRRSLIKPAAANSDQRCDRNSRKKKTGESADPPAIVLFAASELVVAVNLCKEDFVGPVPGFIDRSIVEETEGDITTRAHDQVKFPAIWKTQSIGPGAVP